MKTNFKFLFSFLVFGLVAINSISAQGVGDIPPAHATDDGVITFDTNAPLSGIYAFDFSNKNYTKVEAENVAKNLENVTIALNTQLDFPNKKIIIMIDMTDPAVEGWDVNAWNNYLIEAQN